MTFNVPPRHDIQYMYPVYIIKWQLQAKQGSIYHSISQLRKQKTHLRSNILTEPSAPTEANMSLPPPARLKAISYTYRMKKKMLHVFQLSYQDQNFSQNFTRWQGWISFLLLLKKKGWHQFNTTSLSTRQNHNKCVPCLGSLLLNIIILPLYRVQ